MLNQPIDERPEGGEETVDAFGIPSSASRSRSVNAREAGEWGQKPIWIEPDSKKIKYRIRSRMCDHGRSA